MDTKRFLNNLESYTVGKISCTVQLRRDVTQDLVMIAVRSALAALPNVTQLPPLVLVMMSKCPSVNGYRGTILPDFKVFSGVGLKTMGLCVCTIIFAVISVSSPANLKTNLNCHVEKRVLMPTVCADSHHLEVILL